MRRSISAFFAFIVTLALTDIVLDEVVGLPRWLSLIIALVLAGLAAWGVHKLLDNPLERSARDGRRWEAEYRSQQAWKAEQRALVEEGLRQPHPEMPADLPPADADFETRELPTVAPEPSRSPNQVDRAVDRATSLETPADRDVRRAAEGGQNRIERFFD